MLCLLPLLLATLPTQPPVRLVYEEGDTGCPNRERLVRAVAARLGANPFTDEANEAVSVRVHRAGDSLSAQVVRSGPEGERGRRDLTSPTLDCTELFRALELAVAIAIDPRAGLARPSAPSLPPASPPSSPIQAPAESPLPPEAVQALPQTPTHVHLGLGPSGSLGSGPTATLGLVLIAGLQHGSFELGLGGRVELPSQLGLSPGNIRTQAVVGNLSVCLAVLFLRACALGEAGALRVTSEGLTPAVQQTAVLAGLGGRVAAHFQPWEYLAVRPFLDVTATLARTSVRADGAVVWTTPPAMGTLGVALSLASGR